jgi:hypothetical protein
MVSFKSLLAAAAAAAGVNAAVNQLQTFNANLAANPTKVKLSVVNLSICIHLADF